VCCVSGVGLHTNVFVMHALNAEQNTLGVQGRASCLLSSVWVFLIAWPEPYMHTVYDSMYGDITHIQCIYGKLSNTVTRISYICMVLANPSFSYCMARREVRLCQRFAF